MYKIKDLLDLDHTLAKDYLNKFEYPYEALPGIKEEILRLIQTLDKSEYIERSENVWVHKTAKIFDSAYIGGPTIICENAEVKHCAFIRESALVGKGAVVGNSCEVKNAIIFDKAEVPHFNYVGDSIIGFHGHMGAGSITSNLRSDKANIVCKDKEERLETGLRKMGAIIGDYAEIGCNAVLNPGSIVGRNAMVYPTSCVRGTVREKTIFKNDGTIEEQ